MSQPGITTEHTVWCSFSLRPDPASQNGSCQHHYQHSGSVSSLIQEVKGSGWRKRKDEGWVCPSCTLRKRGVYRKIGERMGLSGNLIITKEPR